jgi:hypothetical protein
LSEIIRPVPKCERSNTARGLLAKAYPGESVDEEMDLSIFAGKTLLITGGTGTFGNAVVDTAAKVGFGEIRIFSRDEKKQDDMRGRLKNAAVVRSTVLPAILAASFPLIRNDFLTTLKGPLYIIISCFILDRMALFGLQMNRRIKFVLSRTASN